MNRKFVVEVGVKFNESYIYRLATDKGQIRVLSGMQAAITACRDIQFQCVEFIIRDNEFLVIPIDQIEYMKPVEFDENS